MKTFRFPNAITASGRRKWFLGLSALLLFAVLSYGFTSKAVETTIVLRETNRLEGYYRSIGTLTQFEKKPLFTHLDALQVLRETPGFGFEDLRVYTSGVMQDYYNTDYDTGGVDSPGAGYMPKGVNTLEYWFTATLVDQNTVMIVDEDGKSVLGGVYLTLAVDNVLLGYPENISAGKSYGLWFAARLMPDAEKVVPALQAMEEGQRYLLRTYVDPFAPHQSSDGGIANASKLLRILALDEVDTYYLTLEPGKNVDMKDPGFSGIMRTFSKAWQNAHALLITGTKDMSALPEVQESQHNMYLLDGRWLNAKDQAEKRPVIVIPMSLSVERQINIGDWMTFTFRGLKEPAFGYIRGKLDSLEWESYPTTTEDFEVVGVYSDMLQDSSFLKSSEFGIAYVPASTIPASTAYSEGVNGKRSPSFDYNFVLNNPRNQDKYAEDVKPLLSPMGYSVSFIQNNARNFMAGVDPLRRSLSIGAVFYSSALFVGITLIVSIYVRQLRRTYAIARAMGLPKLIANKQLRAPLMILGSFGSLAGVLLAWKESLEQAAKSLSQLPLPSGVYPDSTLSLAWLLGYWLLVVLITWFFINREIKNLVAQPVLVLLQEGSNPVGLNTGSEQVVEGEKPALSRLPAITPSVGGEASLTALYRFGGRLLRRGLGRSLLAIALGLALIFSLGWLLGQIERNLAKLDQLYGTTNVQADLYLNLGGNAQGAAVTNYVSNTVVTHFLESGRVEDAYLDSISGVTNIYNEELGRYTKSFPYQVLALNDVKADGNAKGVEIIYIPGYDSSIFSKQWKEEDLDNMLPPIVVPETIMQSLGLHAGGTIRIWELSDVHAEYLIVGVSRGGSLFMGLKRDGVFETHFPFLMPLGVRNLLNPRPPEYSTVKLRLDPRFNRDLDSFKNQSEKYLSDPKVNRFGLRIKFWDEELNAVVAPMEKNLNLLEVLYPISVGVAIILGFSLSVLQILQQSRDCALLRMLGVDRMRLRALLTGQQALLAVMGITLGLLANLVVNQFREIALTTFQAAGLYLLAVILGAGLGACLVSLREPLDLLQVRE